MRDVIKDMPARPLSDTERRVPRYPDGVYAECGRFGGGLADSPPLIPDQSDTITGTAPWLQVIDPHQPTGFAFDLIKPTPAMVNFEVMARVSARIPRFNAQNEGERILSVAQHCIEGARAILRETGNRYHAGAFLIHDGHEYVLGDWARPVQEALCAHAVLQGGDLWYADIVKGAFKSLKNACDAAIYPAAGFPWPLDPETTRVVKEMDMRMGRTERDRRMAPPPLPWKDVYQNAKPVEGVDLYPYSEGTIAKLWMQLARELLPVFQR